MNGFWIFLAIMLVMNNGDCGSPSIKQAIIFKLTNDKQWEREIGCPQKL